MTGPDYIVDIGGIQEGSPPRESGSLRANLGGIQGRPWLAIRWMCCSTYSRIYRNDVGTAYQGRCPRCGKPVRVRVGAGGTADRFFDAY